jgi:glyoxylase-like metal-dependent hydrolase (beta-lactamase superfamily II)
MCFYIEDKYWLIAGDTLFQSSIGRTDFPTGSYGELSTSIKEKIYTLPDWTKVFPGHGESTTVGEEKVSNMFVHL